MAIKYRRSILASIFWFTAVSLPLMGAAALSTGNNPVVYSIGTLEIVTPPNSTGLVEESGEPVTLSTQIRPASTFGDPGLLLNSPLRPGDSYLIPLDETRSYALQYARVYTPVDILAIDPEGTIQSIVPNLVMHDITRPIPLPAGTSAVLYLAGGEAEMLHILPRQRVTHKLFTPPPRILQ